jgi:hypothetical protein
LLDYGRHSSKPESCRSGKADSSGFDFRLPIKSGISQAVKAAGQCLAYSAGGVSDKPKVRWDFRKSICSAFEPFDGSLLFVL